MYYLTNEDDPEEYLKRIEKECDKQRDMRPIKIQELKENNAMSKTLSARRFEI